MQNANQIEPLETMDNVEAISKEEELLTFSRNLKASLNYLMKDSKKNNLVLTSHFINVTILSIDEEVQGMLPKNTVYS